jgi:hypothetical protein
MHPLRPALMTGQLISIRLTTGLIVTAALALGGCSLFDEDEGDDAGGSSAWSWTELGGPDAEVSPLTSNHEPLVVAGTQLLLGTGDGVWRRALSGTGTWERSGLDGLAIHAMALTQNGERIIAAGLDPNDDHAATAWYSTDQGMTWTAASEWPRGEPGSLFEGASFPFYTLEPDPADAAVVYGGLSGDTIAVTIDGGATWIMTDGMTEPAFGDACVSYRSAATPVLLQGCELPLDTAWVGARRVVEQDRFALPDFRFLYGYPDLEELGNRRINSIVGVPAHTDRVLVGVEGGLVELTTESGNWTDRSDIAPRWIMRVEDSTLPYAYIRGIAALDEDGQRLLFGGTVNGLNETLSLFESTDGGLVQLSAPGTLHDPRVEQIWRLNDRDVLLVISEGDPADTSPDAPHRPKVYRLQR